jgi:hypothetical protein
MVELGLCEDVVLAKIRSMSAAGADTVSFDTSIEDFSLHIADSGKVLLQAAPRRNCRPNDAGYFSS